MRNSPGAQEKDFFLRIFRQLGLYKDPYQSISGILKDTCEFFGFFSGFVYEADHAQIFHLCEYYLGPGANLADKFSLSEYLDRVDLDELTERTGEIVYLNSRKTEIGSKFLEFFSAQTLVMIPVIFENKIPIAFVGLMDRRKPIRLSKRKIDDADAVLSVLAGHIKTRVYQRRLEYVHVSMKNIVNNAGIDIYVSDYYSSEILFANESMAAPYGGVDNVLGKKCYEVFSEEKNGICSYCPRDLLIDKNKEPTAVHSTNFHRKIDGQWFRVLHTAFPWMDGRLAHVASSINITENKNNEELIRDMAEHDPLTALPNRRKFMADLDESLEALKQNGGEGYLFFMDLDDFKKINDTLGHLAGDALLCGIGKYLLEHEIVFGRSYRYGGDEFVIIAVNKSEKDMEQIRDALLERFSAEWELSDPGALCSISIGAVKFSGTDDNAKDLIQRADAAMYEVKKSGKHGFHLSGNHA